MAAPVREVAGQDSPLEAFIRCAKSKNRCATDTATENGKQYIELPTTHIHESKILLQLDTEDHMAIMVAVGPAKTSLYHVTTETDIDTTAELLPSGGSQSHHHATRSAVSETLPPQPRHAVYPTNFVDNFTDNPPLGKHKASTTQPFCFGISSDNQKKNSISVIVEKGSKFVASEDESFVNKESNIEYLETSTSRNLTLAFVDFQKIDSSNDPTGIKLIDRKVPNQEISDQPNRMEYTLKSAEPCNKIPKDHLDIGESEFPAIDPTNLYNDLLDTLPTQLEGSSQYLSDLSQTLGGDCFNDLGIPEEKRFLLLKYTEWQAFHSNINIYNEQNLDDQEKEMESLKEQPNYTCFMSMEGYLPSSTKMERELPGMQFTSGNRCHTGSTDSIQCSETCHQKVIISAEHPSCPLGQYITVSPEFMDLSKSHESCVTGDITQCTIKATTQNYSYVDMDHKNSSVNHTNVDFNHQADGHSAEVHHPEEDTCYFSAKGQERHVGFNNVSDKTDQKISTGNNGINFNDPKTCSKDTDDQPKMIMMAELSTSIKNSLFNQDTTTSPEYETSKAGHVTLSSSFKILLHDSNVNRSKLTNQLTPEACSPEEVLPSSFKDTEEKANICSKNAVFDSRGLIGGDKTNNKVTDGKMRMLITSISMDPDIYLSHAKMQKEIMDRRVACERGNGFRNEVDDTKDVSEDTHVRQPHIVIAELSSSTSEQCPNTSSGSHSVFTEHRNQRSDIMLHKIFQKEDIDPDANTLVDELPKEMEPPDGHCTQVLLNSVNTDAMQHMGHENDITLKEEQEEQTTKSLSSNNIMSETWEMKLLKENPLNNITHGSAICTDSNRGNKDLMTSPEEIGNGTQIIINVEFENIIPYPKFLYTDSSIPSGIVHQCMPSNSDPSCLCTNTSHDPSYYKCKTTSSDLFYQSTTTSGSFCLRTTNCLDPSYLCTIMSPDPSYQCTTISPDVSHQCTTITPDQFYQCTTNYPDLAFLCTIASPDPSYQCTNTSPDLSHQCTTISSDQFYQCTTNFSDPLCPCTIISPDPPYQSTTISSDLSYQFTTTSPDSFYQGTTSSYEPSYQCTTTSPDSFYQCTTTSDPSYKCTTTSVDPSYQCTTTSADPSYQCTITSSHPSSYDKGTSTYSDTFSHDKCTSTSFDSSYQCTVTIPSPSYQCTTTDADLSYQCKPTSADTSYQCTTTYADPCYQYTSTAQAIPDSCFQRTSSSPDLFNECTTTFPDTQLISTVNEAHERGHMALQRSVMEPMQDEYGNIIKQNEHYFLEELRKMFLDQQGKGLTLLDSGIVLTKTVNQLEKNIALVTLWDGSELGMVIPSSKLFLYYHLEKHFYVTEQLNDDWYFAQDRITKVNMLMKKVPVTSNWVKSLHNFLCLPSHPRLLTPYAVITDRHGSILFLMEDRHVLGVGTPPLGYVRNTWKSLLELLHFLRYCRTYKLLPRNIKDSILYTEQGIFFDPSSLYNNDDLCELRKCLRDALLCFLCNGQQEFDGHSEVLLERAYQFLEEDCPAQINPTSIFFSSWQGPVPFCLPSFPNEN